MLIGHFAVGFASKRVAPEASLGVLMVAPLLLDIVWPIFVTMGIEHVRIEPGATAVNQLDLYDYPYSHSLVASLFWSVLAGGLYYALARNARTSWIIAGGVFSHWVLDFVSHRPDVPLFPGDPTRLGLGLWNSIVATVVVEGTMFAAGVAIYSWCTRPRNRIGIIGFWSFVALLVVLYTINFFRPPPTVQALMIVSFLSFILGPWAWWFDRHRQITP